MDKSRKILPVGISDFRKIIEEQYYFAVSYTHLTLPTICSV